MTKFKVGDIVRLTRGIGPTTERGDSATLIRSHEEGWYGRMHSGNGQSVKYMYESEIELVAWGRLGQYNKDPVEEDAYNYALLYGSTVEPEQMSFNVEPTTIAQEDGSETLGVVLYCTACPIKQQEIDMLWKRIAVLNRSESK